MTTIKEIREFKDYIVGGAPTMTGQEVGTRHTKRISEQKKDQTFFDDTFTIPHIGETDPKKESYAVRTGFIAEMANGFTEQLISALPKVYTKPRLVRGALSKDREDAADRVASLGNKWAYQLNKQSHNPFKQTFKYLAFTRGEAWIYLPHRPELAQWEGEGSWQDANPNIVPVHFVILDPLVVFHEPTEDVNGQPKRVVCYYKRLSMDIHSAYPHWSKYDSSKPHEEVDFMLYADDTTIYAEVNGEAVFTDKEGKLVNGDGRRNNLYDLVPFVHAYSGWGIETVDKAPENLAFSRTRMLRGRVEEDASMAADFAYNIHSSAWKFRTIITQEELGEDFAKEYHPSEPGKLSVLVIPPSAKKEVEATQVFDAPVFAYRNQVKADLALAYPAPLRGIASGTSGRQEDILAGAGLAFYDCAVENNSTLWAQAFEKALRICYALPDMVPSEVRMEDMNKTAEIKVDTARADPLESLRKAADGDRKQQLKIISHETNLIKYQGYTKEEAESEMARILVEDITYNHPVFREILAMKFAQEEGTMGEFAQISQMMGKQPPIQATPEEGSRGGQPREGNIKTPLGREMIDMSLGRTPPRSPAGV